MENIPPQLGQLLSPVYPKPCSNPPSAIQQPRSVLQIENDKAAERLRVLTEFEARHHDFLVGQGNDYFVENGALIFLADARAEVRGYFGSEHWVLRGTILEKHVDGVPVRLVCQTDGGEEEVEI